MTRVRFREPISGFDVTIPCYQWGQTDGQEYIERLIATTPQGVVYREKLRDTYALPYVVRLMRVVFEQTDAVIHQLRTLSWFAMKNASQVAFYPDADINDFWLVDWQTTIEVERVIDNHLTIELTLVEAPRAVQVSLAHLAQYTIEVMLYLGEQARLSQYAIEVMLHPTAHPAHLSQLAIETMLQPAGRTAYLSQFALEVMVAAPSATPSLTVVGVEAVTVTDVATVQAAAATLAALGVDLVTVTDAATVQLAFPAAILTAAGVETITVSDAGSALFVSGLPADAWASQAVIEVMLQPVTEAQASQAVIEVMLQPVTEAQASQVVIEAMVQPETTALASQVVIEVMIESQPATRGDE